MTETLSHFAIRNISKGEVFYKVFNTIEFGINEEGCLWIKAPQLGQPFIQTSDVVDLVKDGFCLETKVRFYD